MKLHKFRFAACVAIMTASTFSMVLAQSLQTINPADYSVPTWTLIQRALVDLKDASRPYSINITVNGDPCTRVGIAWFTNATCTDGYVQVIELADSGDVDNPEGGDVDNPEGGDVDNPEGGDVDNPEGGDVDNPEGSDVDNPEGSDAESPEGGDVESSEDSDVNNLEESEGNNDDQETIDGSSLTDENTLTALKRRINKSIGDSADFSNPSFEIEATSALTQPLNYSNARNLLQGVEVDEKITYCSHKALLTDLKPGTTYLYRVGTPDCWSDVGTFRTPSRTSEYEFIYVTDTQAENDEEFDISQKTIRAAVEMVPDASFILFNGDFVESWGENNSEWEYEQWFETMQDIWQNNILVVTQGNHDKTPNCNYTWHFNTDNTFNDISPVKTTFQGTTYSFELGDVLYFVLSYEDWWKDGYFDALADWMRQVALSSNATWRVACFHLTMFTGAWHQHEENGRKAREAMVPVFAELGIDIAIQGHDHVYEVMGPINSQMKVAENSVWEQEDVAQQYPDNMTGKEGGIYDVTNGTLYFLNNSAGKKKYGPRDESQMISLYPNHGVENYWDLFTGRFGQTGEPTFSKVSVSHEKFIFTTYALNQNDEPYVFDRFEVIKNIETTNVETPTEDEVKIENSDDEVIVEDTECQSIEAYDIKGCLVASSPNNSLPLSHLNSGIYLIKVITPDKTYTSKIIKR